jgi:hypothetical protein
MKKIAVLTVALLLMSCALSFTHVGVTFDEAVTVNGTNADADTAAPLVAQEGHGGDASAGEGGKVASDLGGGIKIWDLFGFGDIFDSDDEDEAVATGDNE